MKKNLTRLLSILLALVLTVGMLPVSALADGWQLSGSLERGESASMAESIGTQAADDTSYLYNIMFLDCGRKYYSVDSIKEFIDNASAAGFNYIQLAIGNDGLRLLLDDMSLTVNGKTYTSEAVSAAIQAGNKAYYDFTVNELTQTEMDAIIAYAAENGMGVIPCVNTPGHMDAILDAAEALTNKTCSYNGSARTIDVTNDTAVAFTQALLQKYITYFAGKGCTLFNMGADEYANDKYTTGGMGFGNLQSTGNYSYYVTYVNEVAAMIEEAGMTPMAFNDGIYYNNDESSGKFDTNIMICYWSSGWGDPRTYAPMYPGDLQNKGFKLINTHGDYYWVLGKSDWQCSKDKASKFDYTQFQGGTISNPAGAMFCIWGDYPGAETEDSVITKTKDTITAFGGTLPETPRVITTPKLSIESTGGSKLNLNETLMLSLSGGVSATWTASPAGIVELASGANDGTASVIGSSVIVTPLQAGTVTITATVTNEDGSKQSAEFALEVVDPTAPEEGETYTVSVGAKLEVSFPGNVVSNFDFDGFDMSIATHTSPKYQQQDGETSLGDQVDLSKDGTYTGVISDNNGHYLVITATGDISNTTDITKATEFTVERSTSSGYFGPTTYTIQGNGYYLSRSSSGLTANKNNATNWSYSGTGGFYNSKGNLVFYNNSWTVQYYNGTAGHLYNVKKSDPVDETVVTFTGVKEGTTTFMVGNKIYTVKVVDKAPEDAMTSTTLKLEYWITNNQVKESSTSSSTSASISKTDSRVTATEGLEITEVAPAVGYSDKNVYYWKTVRLANDKRQTTGAGDDKTAVGTTLTHVRYYNDAWQYKTADGAWHYFLENDQLVSYYLEMIVVTPQITTYFKDWGYSTGDIGGSDWGQVALTVAVVYPDGTVSPAEGNMFAKSTTIYNYWDSGSNKSRRDMGIVRPVNDQNYTVSKITVTNGKRTGYDLFEEGYTSSTSASTKNWSETDTVTWEKDKNDADKEWYRETTVWDTTYTTEPVVNAANKSGDDDPIYVFQGANAAKLVLIYLEPVMKDTNLNVVYVNETDNNTTIKEMQVSMSYDSTAQEPTFFNSLYNGGTVDSTTGNVQNGTLIADGNVKDWRGTSKGAENYLPDDAYVVNAGKEAQHFSKDITTIPGVAEKYKSGVYKYNGAEISEDGKTLTLHYIIDDSKLKKQYVVDFGLPLYIPLSDLVVNQDEVIGVIANDEEITNTASVDTAHGMLTYDSAKKRIIYTMNKPFDGSAMLTANFRVKYAAETSKPITIGVIPASNVLYEENFLTPVHAKDTDVQWTTEGSTPTAAQQTQKFDAADTKTYNVFGTDDAYKAKVGEAGVWRASDLIDTATNKIKMTGKLTTTFYGNAFDLIGNCGHDTGRVFMVIRPTDPNEKRGYIIDVDTRYSKGTLNQVPLAHVALDKEMQYKVEIMALGLEETTVTPQTNGSAFSVMSARSVRGDEMLRSVVESYGLTMADVQHVSMESTISAASASASVSSTSRVAAFSAAPQADTITHDAGTHVEIDSFRVYRSSDSNKANSIAQSYPTAEQNVTYANILDVAQGEFGAYTESGATGTYTVSNYEAAGGPQNEIYLSNGQFVSFKIAELAGKSIQVSLRAVQDDAASWATSTTGGTPTPINTNTEMYYTVTADAAGIFTIANRGDTLLAIGNVKLPNGVTTANVTPASEIDEQVLLQSLRAAFGVSEVEPEPDVFEPDTFDANVSTLRMLRNKLVTIRISVSSDVSYVTVNGVKYWPSRVFSWQRSRTIQFRDTIGRNESKTYTIVAYDANGAASAPITVNG